MGKKVKKLGGSDAPSKTTGEDEGEHQDQQDASSESEGATQAQEASPQETQQHKWKEGDPWKDSGPTLGEYMDAGYKADTYPPRGYTDKRTDDELKAASVVEEHDPLRERPPMPAKDKIAESRKALDTPLEPGQAFFEAGDGFIMVGEADRPHLWYKAGNNGDGCHINKKR